MINLAKYVEQPIEYVEEMNIIKAFNYLGYISGENALMARLSENH